MNTKDKVYVAGHNGMVGSALVRELRRAGYENIIVKTRAELDLRSQEAVERFFREEKPECVLLAAATVGGIWANMHGQARFLLENLQIETNVIDSAYRHGVRKLLFLGSSCIFPREAPQPIPESALLTGPLEPTNEGYAIAKIAGLKLCEYYHRQYGAGFISVMPCNLYGPNDNFDLASSHMLPALIRKFYEAKAQAEAAVTVWGSGKVFREMLHVDDLARACLFAMEHYNGAEFLNVGYGEDFTVAQIAGMVKEAAGYTGEMVFDTAKPDGMFRKIMDSGKIRALGWKPEISLSEGIAQTYQWYAEHARELEGR